MNKITIKINGIEYNLKGDEKEEYLHKVASYVDKKLKTIMDNNRMLSTTSAAVLTAVNAVDDLFKCDAAYSELLEKLEEAEKSQNSLIEQVEALKKQAAQMEKQNQELKNKVEFDRSAELLKKKEEEIVNLNNELHAVKESSEKLLGEYNGLKKENKELKFQLQTSRYKLIDLQNKLVENQINLVKVKKMNNPLINNDK